MQILTAVQTAQPDYVALAMVLALAAVVAVLAIRKRFFSKTNAPEQAAISAPAPAQGPEKPAAPGAAGQIKLHGVPPKTAAMVMAIVAHNMQKPINELRFISIREVE